MRDDRHKTLVSQDFIRSHFNDFKKKHDSAEKYLYYLSNSNSKSGLPILGARLRESIHHESVMASPIEKDSGQPSDWIDSDALHYDHVTDGDLIPELSEMPHFRVVEGSKPLSEAYVDQSLNEDAYALLFGPLVWEEQNIEAEPSTPTIEASATTQTSSDSPSPLLTNLDEPVDSETQPENLQPKSHPHEGVEISKATEKEEEKSALSESSPPENQNLIPAEKTSPEVPAKRLNIYGEVIEDLSYSSEVDQSDASNSYLRKTVKVVGALALVIALGTAAFLTIDHLQGGTYFKTIKEDGWGKLLRGITNSQSED